jgi:quercetin dioxygenase-like cupin family protein
MSAFGDLGEIAPQQLAAGYLARAVHGGRVTFAVVEIEPHAELPAHDHDNEQLGMVLTGSITFRIGEEERVLERGGTWVIPSGVSHFVRGGPDGAVVLDIFAPAREEWKQLERLPPETPTWP